jgi:hypothetical protein
MRWLPGHHDTGAPALQGTRLQLKGDKSVDIFYMPQKNWLRLKAKNPPGVLKPFDL